MLGLIFSPIPFTVLVFEFDPNEYMVREDVGTVDLSVALAEGDLGEFTIVLTAATDDNNINANATGKYIMKFYSTVGPHRVYIPGSSDYMTPTVIKRLLILLFVCFSFWSLFSLAFAMCARFVSHSQRRFREPLCMQEKSGANMICI